MDIEAKCQYHNYAKCPTEYLIVAKTVATVYSVGSEYRIGGCKQCIYNELLTYSEINMQ